MKRVALLLFAVLVMASLAVAQASGTQAQNAPAAQSGAAQSQTPGQPGTPAAPPAKHPPQAKTQPEFDAYKAAAANTDPAAMEKAADDFAAKFPDSELRVLLYKNATRLYQNSNNADKLNEMATQ